MGWMLHDREGMDVGFIILHIGVSRETIVFLSVFGLRGVLNQRVNAA
jgi:hypothetical protein